MAGSKHPLIFDGHNDLLFALTEAKPVSVDPFFDDTGKHLDESKCRTGGFGGGFFAVYVSSPVDIEEEMKKMEQPAYSLELPDPVSWEQSAAAAHLQMATLFQLEKRGGLKLCRDVTDIENCLKREQLAAILHFEGAEPIDAEFNSLEVYYQAGLRSVGIVWSRPNLFGHGVPFRFPSDGDTGPGLTELGVALVKRCNEMGILVDVSHLNEAGFWDVARVSDRPIVATHSNAHAICPHARNLTDRQLDAIKESDGMVGVNLALAFLREDGRMVDTGLDTVLRHFDYLIERIGEDRVGFGSDFDGAKIPGQIGTAAGLPNLRHAMIDHGFGEPLMMKLCSRNWLRLLRQTWL
ncbi:MAG: dipeptidase [Rhizobiaceae bacterium]